MVTIKFPGLISTCVIYLLISNKFSDGHPPSRTGKLATKAPPSSSSRKTTSGKLAKPTSNPTEHQHKSSPGHHMQGALDLDLSEVFCRKNPKVPFYQRLSDGAVCCRGKEILLTTDDPETTGECAISTKTNTNGTLDSDNLWCAYTCTMKKLGAIDAKGRVVPEIFFAKLAFYLSTESKARVKAVMSNYLNCFKPIKNAASPCHTPLIFHKCFLDALYFICSFGMPKKADLPKFKKLALGYEKLQPACVYDKRKVVPGCCHGKPIPWTIREIMEAQKNDTAIDECVENMDPDCENTCFLKSTGVAKLKPKLELDVGAFQKTVLQHFPAVKASSWMYSLGTVFLFHNESLAETPEVESAASDTSNRVCDFHDTIMEIHEVKVEQYCAMSPDEIKEFVKINAGGPSG